MSGPYSGICVRVEGAIVGMAWPARVGGRSGERPPTGRSDPA
ncbi:MAG: hypothetical protein WC804_17765 [Sphingomonas sp.]